MALILRLPVVESEGVVAVVVVVVQAVIPGIELMGAGLIAVVVSEFAAFVVCFVVAAAVVAVPVVVVVVVVVPVVVAAPVVVVVPAVVAVPVGAEVLASSGAAASLVKGAVDSALGCLGASVAVGVELVVALRS